MKREIKALFKRIEYLDDRIKNLTQVHEGLLNLTPEDKFVSLPEARDFFNKQIEDADTEREQLYEAVRSFQRDCKHQMNYTGHNSHHDHYKCSKCGYTDYYC